jgi:hypothetical protein
LAQASFKSLWLTWGLKSGRQPPKRCSVRLSRLALDSSQNVSLRTFIFAGLLLGIWSAEDQVLAQLADEVTRIYTLRTNSTLKDDCPICARTPIVVPMTGTFRLRFLNQDPLFTRYQVQDISFHAGARTGPEYWVTGSGTYQVGGEVAVSQKLFLDTAVSQD